MYTPDIVKYAGFTWYQWAICHDYDKPNKERIGMWLGPTIGSDQDISYRILTGEGKFISRSPMNHPTSDIHNMLCCVVLCYVVLWCILLYCFV